MKTLADYNTIHQILDALLSDPHCLTNEDGYLRLTSEQCKELLVLLRDTEGDYFPTKQEIQTYKRDKSDIKELNFREDMCLFTRILNRIYEFEINYGCE